MFPNGYIIVDVGGLDITTSSSQTISGIYDTLVDAMKANKPVALANVRSGGTYITPVFAYLKMSGNIVVINDTHNVTVSDVVSKI